MAHLIKTLKSSERDVRQSLSQAYDTLARAYLIHRHALTLADITESRSPELHDLVVSTEEEIDLTAARRDCALIGWQDPKEELVGGYSERPIEVFNCLCHAYVLLEAIDILERNGLGKPSVCAPTQQSTDNGDPISDLEGSGWILEAFGGVRYSNNKKLDKDLASLRRDANGRRMFLGCRREAISLASGTRTKTVKLSDGSHMNAKLDLLAATERVQVVSVAFA